MTRNIRKLRRAFEQELNPRLRDKIRAQIDAAERATSLAERLTRQREKNLRAQELVDKAEEIKARAQKQRDQRAAERQAKREPKQDRTACTCRKPQVDRNGKCRRCHKVPAGRRKGFWG